MSTTLEKRSPLKSAPLRNPGQSLDEAIDRLLIDKAAPYVYGSAMFLAIAWIEWWKGYLSIPPQSLVVTAIALITVLTTTRTFVVIRPLKLNRRGEKAAGQYLEQRRCSQAGS